LRSGLSWIRAYIFILWRFLLQLGRFLFQAQK